MEMLKNTGHEEISLSSLSSSDYSKLPELIDFLIEECDSRHINISLPSLRIDAFSLDVMSKVQDVRKSSLTFAPEAGSQRLRDVINKGLTEEVILKGARMAFEGGWTRVKLYFMLGLPTETEEDIRGIAELSNKIAAEFFDAVPKEERKNGRVQIVTSTSFFIPKPFTPFQWAKQFTKEEFLEKAEQTKRAIASQLNQKVSNITGMKPTPVCWRVSLPEETDVCQTSFSGPTRRAAFMTPGANTSIMTDGLPSLRNAIFPFLFTLPGNAP